MNFSQALSFCFRDESWFKKIILGGLLNFFAWFTGILFFLGFFAIEYTVEVIRNVLKGQEIPLPEWNDMGKKFVDGLLVFIIGLVYVFIIGGIGAIWIVYVATSEVFYGGIEALLIVIGAVGIAIGLGVFISAATIRYAATDNFGAAFNFGEVYNLISAQFGSLLAIIIFVTILQVILLLMGLGIFSPFTAFYGMVVEAHLLGQYGREVYQADETNYPR